MTVPAAGRGTTTVTPRAVRRIAERAASEALPDGGTVTSGSASVHGASARVKVGVRLPYPLPADEAAERIQERARTRTAALTGLSVPHADVRINSLSVHPLPPARTPSGDEPRGTADAARGARHTVRSGGPGGRIRAQRRIPSALTAAVGAIGCALLLVDVIAVRLGDAPAAWRTWLVDWASTHGPADTAVRFGGVLAALTGAWLLGCALLPGQRRRLTMAAPAPELRAALDRSAAARVVQDRTAAVGGVVRVRVRVRRRRRVKVLAEVGYGAPEQVRAEVVRVVQAALPELGLARTPTLRVGIRVRRAPHGPPPSAEKPRQSTTASTTATPTPAQQREV
ncbi:DEAD/DEAH box helicase [Streptomyces sp. SID4928]|uniref:DUF6286 domain-containing Asp23/Gls24 family envelope stress response protein n=1 Tax=unclassified Streptomyces TaxID=2593676 RepID=UPI0001C1A039|nr:DUF6286 domain-containing protein [Streptomyces sp. ACT-1]EGE39819.1 hypothetical protein SACT1_0424 [Streptomyces sp. ACT-1]MYR47903.1 DEAD/DEAH box helicase [Streptomyces sp. SID4928]